MKFYQISDAVGQRMMSQTLKSELLVTIAKVSRRYFFEKYSHVFPAIYHYLKIHLCSKILKVCI